jgi:predicted transcriptional regulator
MSHFGCVTATHSPGFSVVDGYFSQEHVQNDMSENDRDVSNRFTAQNSDDEVLAAVRKQEPPPTSEVAGELGSKHPSTDYRLRQLEEADHVTRQKIGNSLAWSLTTEADI